MQKETRLNYVKDIIDTEDEFAKPIDVSKLPVFKVDNCEVLFSTLTMDTPKSGHSISVLLPKDTEFAVQDTKLRQYFLKQRQEVNDEIENVKKCYKKVSEADLLESQNTKYPIPESHVGRIKLTTQVTNAVMFSDNEKKRISKLSELKGDDTATVRYYRVKDAYTGVGINPVIFKFNDKGEKVTTFISPKDKIEKPLFVSSGDIVNIKIRPYEKVNTKTDEITLRYNLLSIEIVQTAYERNGGKTSYAKHTQKEAPDAVDLSGLANLFGSVEEVETPKEKPVKKTTKQPVEEKKEVSEEIPFNEGLKEEKKTETKATANDKSTDDMWADLEKEFNI